MRHVASPAGQSRFGKPIGSPLDGTKISPRIKAAFGSGRMGLLFNGSPQTPVPWPMTRGSKKAFTHDKAAVKEALENPGKHPLQPVDTRTLVATQPTITRAGVAHYLNGESGLYADKDNAGNARPVVFHNTTTNQNVLLTGHHRAAARMLKGEPLMAVVVNGVPTPRASVNLSRRDEAIDLVRHVRTQAGSARWHEPIGAPIEAHKKLSIANAAKAARMRAAMATVRKPTIEKSAYPVSAVEYQLQRGMTPQDALAMGVSAKVLAAAQAKIAAGSTPESEDKNMARMVASDPDKEQEFETGGPVRDKDYHNSVAMQFSAQKVAQQHLKIDAAGAFWNQYQMPAAFHGINDTLRGPDGPEKDKMLGDAKQMFDEQGYTTTRPTTVYRGTQSGTWDRRLLTPGAIFSDGGMTSTSAEPNFAAGWIAVQTQGNQVGVVPVDPTDILMEIQMPSGTRVVGGTPDFIETMLAPNAKLQVVSVERRTYDSAVVPLDGSTPSPFRYTHVTTKLVDDGTSTLG